MRATMDTPKLKDLTRAASILADAAEESPRALKTVDTTLGSADVVVDDQALDIDFQDRKVSVHVRFEEPKNAI